MKAAGKMHETQLQIQMVHALQIDFLPADLMYTHVPNGGSREKVKNKSGNWWCPEGVKLKKMGLLPGVADLVFWWPVAIEEDGVNSLWLDTGFIEVKVPGGVLRDEQITFRKNIKAMGGKYASARSYEEVRAALVSWGVVCQFRVNF